MKKILLSHTQLNDDKLKTRAELHITRMNQNETYTEFQPVITTLKTLLDSFVTAVALAEQGGKDRTKAKKRCEGYPCFAFNQTGAFGRN